MRLEKLDSPFLKYLIEVEATPGTRIPALNELSDELGISVGKLREQLEVARSLGLVSVRPRVGIQREPFDFSESLLNSVLFSLAMGEADFEQYSQLRQVVELGFWDQAVRQLSEKDKGALRELVGRAWERLRGEPIHIPNREHREFHLTIFKRLNNPFVQGILATYWDAYEASELTRFVSYAYWVDVWAYHEQIVDALCTDDFARGRQLLIEHFALLHSRPTTAVEPPPSGIKSIVNSEGAIK
jgi:DNA-binding FadR family transcriptional regulator